MLVIGQIGTGKSTLLRQMAVEDYIRARNFALIDPHGGLAEALHMDLDFYKMAGFSISIHRTPLRLMDTIHSAV